MLNRTGIKHFNGSSEYIVTNSNRPVTGNFWQKQDKGARTVKVLNVVENVGPFEKTSGTCCTQK